MVLLCQWTFQVAYYLSLEDLAWIVGWNIAALRLGCDTPSLCNSMYLLDYINTNLFP